MLFLCNIANVAQRTFKIVQKSRSRKLGDIINYIDKNVQCTLTARVLTRILRLQRVRYRATFQESCIYLVCDNGIVEVSLLRV